MTLDIEVVVDESRLRVVNRLVNVSYLFFLWITLPLVIPQFFTIQLITDLRYWSGGGRVQGEGGQPAHERQRHLK